MESLTKDIARNIELWGRKISERKGARDQVIKILDKERLSVDALVLEQQKYKQAHTFMMSELSERRNLGIKSIENIATSGLKMIYGPSYGLQFDTFDEKRSEEGIASYKMEIRVRGILDGKPQNFILQGGKGGSVQDGISLMLRDASLTWQRYDGFMMFDEAYKYMSRDDKINNVAALLRQNADLTGRQYIFATHMVDLFAPVADNIIRFVNTDGVVRGEYVSPGDIVEIEEEYGIEEEDE